MRDGDSPARRCVLLCFGAVFHSLASLLASHNFLGSRLPKKGPEEKSQGWVSCQAKPRSWSSSLTLSTSGTSSRPQRSMPSAETSASSKIGSKRRRGQRAARRRQQLCVVEFQKLESMSRHLVLTMTTSPNARALKRPLSENF